MARGRSNGRFHATMSVALGLGLGFFVLTAVVGVLGVGLVVGYQNTVDLLAQKAELIISSGLLPLPVDKDRAVGKRL